MSPAPSPRVIALDGPSGSGKSTVARGVARLLGLPYVDTGAMYRAATLAVLRAGVSADDPAGVERVVAEAAILLSSDPDAPRVQLEGDDVTAEIRGPEVTAAVSAVSAVPAVRQLMVARQRALAAGGAVVEGRDIGTAVAPDAAVKVFLDADPGVRAARRAGDRDTGVRTDGDVVRAVAVDLARRDRLDSTRRSSPLQAAPDAVHLDSTTLSADEVIARVLELAAAAGFEVPGD
ncbi:MAG: CMP/dCMP kinase [Actinomycetota bacterium]|nr:CMP/dCMP kinase [Actinomycetota bacterium]